MSELADYELIISRLIDAPRALVFEAFSKREHLAQWWGPKGAAIEVHQFEFKPGGMFLYRLSNSEGMEMWGRFVYKEIIENERLVFVSSFSDAGGGLTRAPFSEDFPLEILNVYQFNESNGKTALELSGNPVQASDRELAFFKNLHASMQQGFGGTFEQLDQYLAQIS